jgi:hypothetical protein
MLSSFFNRLLVGAKLLDVPVWRYCCFFGSCSSTQWRLRENDHLVIRSSSLIRVNFPGGERSNIVGAQC